MAAPANQHRGISGLRSSLVVVGALLGIAAICLIVFGTSNPRQLLIGIILGLWAALLAAFGLPGFKRAAPEAGAELRSVRTRLDEVEQAQLRATQDGLVTTQESIAAQGVEIRRLSELQLARETAARRESDLALQHVMRKEMEQAIADGFTGLRDEFTALRAEVLENLGGQIKLERIETTRVIGSDLEALQDEIRRLASQRGPTADDLPVVDVQQTQMPARAAFSDDSLHPENPVSEILDAEIVESASPGTVVVVADVIEPAARYGNAIADEAQLSAVAAEVPGFSPAWGPVRSVRTKAARLTVPDPVPQPPVPPSPEPLPVPDPQPLPPPEPLPDYRRRNTGGRDPFADLPRLSPVSPDLLGLSGKRRAPEGNVDPAGSNANGATPASVAPVDATGSGRRRAPGHASGDERR